MVGKARIGRRGRRWPGASLEGMTTDLAVDDILVRELQSTRQRKISISHRVMRREIPQKSFDEDILWISDGPKDAPQDNYARVRTPKSLCEIDFDNPRDTLPTVYMANILCDLVTVNSIRKCLMGADGQAHKRLRITTCGSWRPSSIFFAGSVLWKSIVDGQVHVMFTWKTFSTTWCPQNVLLVSQEYLFGSRWGVPHNVTCWKQFVGPGDHEIDSKEISIL